MECKKCGSFFNRVPLAVQRLLPSILQWLDLIGQKVIDCRYDVIIWTFQPTLITVLLILARLMTVYSSWLICGRSTAENRQWITEVNDKDAVNATFVEIDLRNKNKHNTHTHTHRKFEIKDKELSGRSQNIFKKMQTTWIYRKKTRSESVDCST